MLYGQRDFIDTLKGNIQTVMGKSVELSAVFDIDEQIDVLQKRMLRYVELNAKSGANNKDHDSKFEQVSKDIRDYKSKRRSWQSRKNIKQIMGRELIKYLNLLSSAMEWQNSTTIWCEG